MTHYFKLWCNHQVYSQCMKNNRWLKNGYFINDVTWHCVSYMQLNLAQTQKWIILCHTWSWLILVKWCYISFWNVMPQTQIQIYQHFGRIDCLHTQSMTAHSSEMWENSSLITQHYTALHPKRCHFAIFEHNHSKLLKYQNVLSLHVLVWNIYMVNLIRNVHM